MVFTCRVDGKIVPPNEQFGGGTRDAIWIFECAMLEPGEVNDFMTGGFSGYCYYGDDEWLFVSKNPKDGQFVNRGKKV